MGVLLPPPGFIAAAAYYIDYSDFRFYDNVWAIIKVLNKNKSFDPKGPHQFSSAADYFVLNDLLFVSYNIEGSSFY